MPISLPFTFVADTDANADQVNANFTAIKTRFDAGIIDADISITAFIDGSKISNQSGKQIPTDRIAPNAIESTRLASLAVATTHIQDLAVTNAKIADGTIQKAKLASTLSLGQMDILTVTATVSVSFSSGPALFTISSWSGGTPPAVNTYFPIAIGATSGGAISAAGLSLSWDGSGANWQIRGTVVSGSLVSTVFTAKFIKLA